MISAEPFAHIELLTPQAKPTPFGSLWADGPVVVTFLRQFGCIFCHQAAAEVLDHRSEIERHARIAFIGNGNPSHAAAFANRLGLEGCVYTDPARLLYNALRLNFGVFKTVNVASRRLYRQAQAQGFRQIGTWGDRWQLGGTFVINAGGLLVFTHRSEHAGEHASLRDLLLTLPDVTSQPH